MLDGKNLFPISGNYKNGTMKKILIFLIVTGFLTGCYPEFRNDFPYTTVAFTNATGGLTTAGQLGRTVVKDEGLQLDFGIYLGGVIENQEERWAKFTIDPTLLAGTSYVLMPSDYYTLSNSNTITIPSGDFVGKITIKIDSVKFLNDVNASHYHYAIPLKLTETSADSINATLSTKLLVIKYINHYDGYYDNTATFTTYNATGTPVNSGTVKNVILGTTLALDSIITDGINNMTGIDYRMKTLVKSDKTVWYKKIPNMPRDMTPKNIAILPTTLISTSFVSSWEKLEAIRDNYSPTSSTDKTGGAYGNWNSANIERYVEYDFPQSYKLSKSEVYWWTDGGGILFPDYCRLEYMDPVTQTWLLVPNPVGLGVAGNTWNVTTFDEIVTNKIRMSFKNSVQSVGILEWRIWGVSVPVSLEQAPIEDVIAQGANTFDPATSKYTLNYKVTYEDLDYYTVVSSTMVWRNRVRDGVNEWRR